MNPAKERLRTEMKSLLAGVSPEELEAAARCTQIWLNELPMAGVRYVLLYQPLEGELPSLGIRDWALERGLQVCYPRTVGLGLQYFVGDPQTFVRDARGFWGPAQSSPRWKGQPALLFAPALAADEAGFRLGRGGGYFDRFLAQNPQVFPVIHLLDAQIKERLPVDTWDLPFRALLSPKKLRLLVAQSPRGGASAPLAPCPEPAEG